MGADNTDTLVRFTSWNKVGALWIPRFLLQVTATFDATIIGVAGEAAVVADTFADTITASQTAGLLGTLDRRIISPAGNDLVASLSIQNAGFDLLQVDFDRDGGASAATSVNALFRQVSL